MTSAKDSSLAAPSVPDPAAKFDGSLRADQATKIVLLELLAVMEFHESGVLQRSHEECLHDYRIAVRRGRSALSQLRESFPPSIMTRFAPKLIALGRVTTPARDLDVHLLGFDALKSSVPNHFQDALEPLRAVLLQQADWAYGELFRHLSSGGYRRFMADWRRFLETPPPARPRATEALTPIIDLAGRRIWKLYRRAIKQGRAIKDRSPAECLHELRKTCKKLRYLLEFFRHLYPEPEITRAIKLLKRLQDYLGEFQDVEVQIHKIQELGQIMRKQSAVPTDTLLAMGALLGRLDHRESRLREEFARRFRSFASTEHQAEYRSLFRPVELAALKPAAELTGSAG
ncbi:MAG: CHAD domain-containing protein [Methylococcaceae bacterium]|nr:CHAD domain-containing protein [Methylococcaceae bacterium]